MEQGVSGCEWVWTSGQWRRRRAEQGRAEQRAVLRDGCLSSQPQYVRPEVHDQEPNVLVRSWPFVWCHLMGHSTHETHGRRHKSDSSSTRLLWAQWRSTQSDQWACIGRYVSMDERRRGKSSSAVVDSVGHWCEPSMVQGYHGGMSCC